MLEKNIKNVRQQFREQGVYYTDKELAKKLKSYINIDVKNVYDPTCGQGDLLAVFDDEVEKFGQELDEAELNKCKANLVNFTGYAGDTLKDPRFIDYKFDCIIANYPFSVKWDVDNSNSKIFDECKIIPPKSKADYAFILHILHCLSDSGVAVSLNFPGVLYRGNKEGGIRKWLVEKNYIDEIVNIEGGYFVDTKIPTAIIVFKKNKENTDIKFTDNKTGKSYIAKINEIKDNDYCLSVQNYVTCDAEKEQINPIEQQKLAREGFLKLLKKELDFDKMVCNIENWDNTEYVKMIKKTIENYE